MEQSNSLQEAVAAAFEQSTEGACYTQDMVMYSSLFCHLQNPHLMQQLDVWTMELGEQKIKMF